ncbi:MAG: UDP-3-O-(3-hydroxymyristoyl)glucosamine N-acyltransferase [Bacteroidetes bacterium]|nr:UDP-3-O-(3-hydroxymyristoyl)glucosamine N-acyltransferase [Bacteroidota bacterium]MCK5766370.1 UDP-3-O-(3-hydroxymyristoyl)glucosamine N-acyltransferase [Bacteroidales bacterium]
MKFSEPQSLKQISDFLNAKYIGDPSHIVSGMNEIHMVEKGDLTFVDHPKYYDMALNSDATTILINKDVECPDGKGLIISDDPFVDFNKLSDHFRPFVPANEMVSATAEIGEGTVIQPGAFIGEHVKIGKNCLIHPNASVYGHCILGDNVILHSGSVIGADGFYFQKRKGETLKFKSVGRVILGNHVEIGANTTIDKGVTGDTYVGDYTKFDNHVQVGHDTQIGRYCLIGAFSAIAGVTRIEDNVILWASVLIDKDLVIGEGAVMLATAGTTKSLEGGKVYYGVPAIEVRKAWQQMALIKKLPEIWEKVRKL